MQQTSVSARYFRMRGRGHGKSDKFQLIQSRSTSHRIARILKKPTPCTPPQPLEPFQQTAFSERICFSCVYRIDSSHRPMPLRNPIAAALLFVATGPFAFAQSAAQPNPPSATPLTFEVVTIKPSHAPGWNMYPTTDGYHGIGVSLRQLVREAYGVFDPKLLTGGDGWIDADKFDLEAKFNPADVPNAKDLPYRQRADMLRAVLADRFQLKVHFEQKIFPVYNLVIATAGPKLKDAPPEHLHSAAWGPTCLHTQGRAGIMAVEGCGTGALADSLRSPSGRTVIDKTGLTGRYDFELHWTPDNAPADSPLAGGPSIFTAVEEQLGLKLEPSTAPLDVLVIDSAQKPTPN
jgi:uncharacterized protein (TIGR03435 family)